MSVAKKWTLVKVFDGAPKPSDFKLEEEQVSTNLKDGELLLEAVYLSADPYMRLFAVTPDGDGPIKSGVTMSGEQVAKVVASKSPKYAVGSLVLCHAGWRTLTVLPDSKVRVCPDTGKLPPSAALGVLGMPGATAYFGLLEVCQPKAGEVVLVSGAAGAVGSVVGQIAKIKGCRVIGFAGTKEKVEWLKQLGFDFAFNYKEDDIEASLKKAAPDGIDCYFDNVGGNFTSKVFSHMKDHGRMAIIGGISTYNVENSSIPNPLGLILGKQLKVQGFVGFSRFPRWSEAFSQILTWVQEGKIQYRETVTEGFDRMPEAFLSLFKGGNIGKVIVKL